MFGVALGGHSGFNPGSFRDHYGAIPGSYHNHSKKKPDKNIDMLEIKTISSLCDQRDANSSYKFTSSSVLSFFSDLIFSGYVLAAILVHRA